MDILEESKIQENDSTSPKARRVLTDEQKAEAVRIVAPSGKPIRPIAPEMGLTESTLRNWVKPSQIDQTTALNGALTPKARPELNRLRRDNQRLPREREFFKKAAAFGGAVSFP